MSATPLVRPLMQTPPEFGGQPGQPVPTVDPDDLRAVWRVYRGIEETHPGERVGICMDSLVRECKLGADVQAVVYRTTMLRLIRHVAPERLTPWMKGQELSDAVFLAAAEIPMEWIGRGVERQGLPLDVDDFFSRVSSSADGSEPR